MRTTIYLIIILFKPGLEFAQSIRFPPSGVIEFEKTVNMYALMKNSVTKENEIYQRSSADTYIKNNSQFKRFKSVLTFTSDNALYSPLNTESNDGSGLLNFPQSNPDDIVYTSFVNNQSVCQKRVFEQIFLVTDSVKKIKWKITDETRDIAGYVCRRANGIILDSVYIVAFYAERIHVPGGPAAFHGLPGMILGLALPHENVTWFATKVTDVPVSPNSLLPPKSGKPVKNSELRYALQNAMKNWGQQGRSFLNIFLL